MLAFFTSHRSPLSERLEQATSLRKADVLPVGREATTGNTSAVRRLSGSKWAEIQYIRNSNTFTQEPIKWSLHFPYKPLESTLSRVDL